MLDREPRIRFAFVRHPSAASLLTIAVVSRKHMNRKAHTGAATAVLPCRIGAVCGV